MTATVAIVIEGVLRQFVGEGAIPQGIRLYHGLNKTYKIALISDQRDSLLITKWLDENGFNDHPYLIMRKDEDPPDDVARRVKQMGLLREHGCQVDLVIDPNPLTSAALLKTGIAVMPFIHPKYARPEFRPDYEGEVTPWSTLVAEVELEADLRVKDNRELTLM